MSTATVTPGYVFANNELVTYPKLNALGNPGVSITLTGSLNPQNYLRNGNFYGPYWNNVLGVNCPVGIETGNAAYWTVNPQGASVTYSQSSAVPNAHSLYSAQITGNTSTTTVNLDQNIPGDLSDTLNATVSFSCWIQNNSGINMVPVLIVSSANALNNFSIVSQIASANMGTIPSGQWQYETATINLSGLTNVNNGIQITIQFPSGALSSNTQSVNVSQAMLTIGSTPITYIDDFGLFPPPEEGEIYNAVLNGNFDVNQPQGTYTGIVNSSPRTFDCWSVNASGTLSVSHVLDSSANIVPTTPLQPYLSNAGRITVQTAEVSLGAGDFLLVNNLLEGYTVSQLQGRSMSLQFWVKSSTIGTYYVVLRNSNSTANFISPYSITAANTWQQILIQNIPAMPTTVGTWNFTNGIGLAITWALALGSNSQTTSGNVGSWIATGGVYGTAAQANLVSSTANNWEITGVQLEAGPICNPLNYLPFNQMLPLCQRYYYKTTPYATVVSSGSILGAVAGIAVNNLSAFVNVRAPVKMRGTPVANSYWGLSAAQANDISTSTTLTGVVPTNITEDGFNEITYTSSGSTGNTIILHASLDARL